jgi:ferritin-like protein
MATYQYKIGEVKMTALKQKVLKHIMGYCKRENINIDAEDILADLNEFLERVDAPDDLSAFYELIALITRVNNVSTEVANFIQQILRLAHL